MATSVTPNPLTEDTLKVRYREPYLSAALNEKFTRFVPAGIYNGFQPTTSGTNLHITMAGSTGHLAIVNSSLDPDPTDPLHQVSVHLNAGTIDIDLSAYASKTVALVLEASYSFPTTTSGSLNIYDLGTETVPAYACTICQVTVPAAGLIPASDIVLTGRTLPWEERTRDNVPYLSVLKNGSFEFGNSGVAPPYWETLPTGTVGTVQVASTTPPSGVGNVLVFLAASTTPTQQTAYARQDIGISVTPSRSRLRYSLYYNAVQAPVGANNPKFSLGFFKSDDNTLVTTLDLDLTTTGTYTKSVDLNTVVSLPSPTNGIYLGYASISFNNAEYAAIGPAFYVSDISVELESDTTATQVAPALSGEQRITRLTVVDPSNVSGAGKGVTATYSQAANQLSFAESPAGAPAPSVYAPVFESPSVLTPSLDRGNAGTLTVGGTTQTGLVLGRVGATTTAKGSTVTLDSASVVVGADATGTTTVRSATVKVGDSADPVGKVTTVEVGDLATNGIYVGATGLISPAGQVWVGSAGVGENTTTIVRGTNLFVGTGTTTKVVLGNGTSGVVRVDRYLDGKDGGLLSLGTDGVQTGGLELGQVGQTAAVLGNFSVAGTTYLGAVTATNVDSQFLGGVLNLGGALAGSINVGNSGTTAINVGTSVLAGATVALGQSGGGRTTNVKGNSVNVGNDSGTTTVIGNTGATTTISGSTMTVDGTTVRVGYSASTSTVAIGTVTTGAATVTVGNSGVGNTVATTVAGNTVAVGGTFATSIDIGSSGYIANSGTASVNVGFPSGSGTNTTNVQGDVVNIGTNANTDSVLVGDGSSGKVRINRYIDGNTGTLSVGTDTTRSTGIELGNAPTGGTVVTTVQGNTVNLGTDADTTAINIGGTTAPTTSRTTTIGYNGASNTVNLRGSTIAAGDTATATMNIGTSTATNAAINIGSAVGGQTVTTTVLGNTINIGNDADTSVIALGNGAVGTTGVIRIANYLDGNSGALSLGTNSTYTTGAITLGNTSRTLTATGSTVAVESAGTISVGASTATTVSLGRTGQEQRAKGALVAEGALHVDNGVGAVGINTKMVAPAFVSVYGLTSATFTTTNTTLAVQQVGVATPRNITFNNASDTVTFDQTGWYAGSISVTVTVTTVGANIPNCVVFENGGSAGVYFVSGNSTSWYVLNGSYSPAFADNFANNVTYLVESTPLIVGVSSAGQTFRLQMHSEGTLGVGAAYQFAGTVTAGYQFYRIAPYS